MIRLLYTGDWHLRGTRPRNRLDDYKETVKAKLREVFYLAKKWDVKGIIVPGDIFDRPEVSIAMLLEYAEVLKESPVMIYTTPGNHDIYGYNISTYWRSSLRLLEMLVPNFKVMVEHGDYLFLSDHTAPATLANTKVQLSFTPYSAKMDVNGYGYDVEGPAAETTDIFKIHVAHGMLLDHKPPFDRYTFVQDVKTTADLVLTGHDHTGYGMYKRADGKVFCNPGSLTRLAASVAEMERPIRVVLITVDDGEAGLEFINLETAQPGDDVLDRSKIEAERQRTYAMESFSALIESKAGERVILDINQIVEQIASLEGSAPHIVKATLEIIDAQREKVKP